MNLEAEQWYTFEMLSFNKTTGAAVLTLSRVQTDDLCCRYVRKIAELVTIKNRLK